MPKIEFMGVRSSWLMLARKRLLAMLAASADRACFSDASNNFMRCTAIDCKF